MTSAALNLNLQRISINCRSFFIMCKPRVTALIVFTALIGMFLATPGMVPLGLNMMTRRWRGRARPARRRWKRCWWRRRRWRAAAALRA